MVGRVGGGCGRTEEEEAAGYDRDTAPAGSEPTGNDLVGYEVEATDGGIGKVDKAS
jgi:hypothetical protein